MNRKALVVGINTYSHLQSLNAPAADANAIAQRLEQDGEFRVIRCPEAIVQVEGGDRRIPQVGSTLPLSQAELKAQLKELFLPGSTQIPDTALFYFSGHGVPAQDGHDRGYLATSDTQPSADRFGISLGWLQWLLAESPIKQQIVWLDCCHSGALLVNVQAANPGHEDDCDRCFIASSRDYEKSWQDLNSPYSVLTNALLAGLDPTRLPGRWIDSFALVDYVNQALRGELQSPVCTNFGDAINLTRSWQVEAKVEATPTDTSRCPYKGLEYFGLNDDDPHYFFGREALTGQLLDQVRTSSFLALVGASGNGKSSVLRAGLLHQLQLGRRIAGSDQWQIVIMRPDAQPMKNLAMAFLPEDGSQLDRAEALGRAEGLLREGGAGLARLVEAAPAPRVMLVVDQFEEVFTRCGDIDERERFFACLMGALQTTGDKLCLVIAMRSDFVGKCLERDYSGLAQQVQQHMESVLPMRPDELRDAICKPAVQVGLTVEDALVTEILNDIQGAPGSLPLLQYTLKELWQRRQDNQLVLSAYQALGGINGTLDQRATELYNSFDPDQQRTVQHIFQQLTQLGEGTEDTRRRVFLDNLVSEPLHPAKRVQTVVETLADKDNRLLVTSEVVSKDETAERRAIVDVAHEALIRHWTLLRQWIEQNRDLLRQQRRIEASAVTWQEHQKSKGYLLQGLPLDEAIQFQKQQVETFPLSDVARAFIQKSRRHRQWTRFQTASWLVIPALVIVGIVEHNIREQRVRADIGRIDDNEGGSEEKYAVADLVKGCRRGVPRPDQSLLGNYIGERILLGQCRSLIRFDLSFADLSFADLSNADFRSVDLSFADLSYANLSLADLRLADLSNADLSNADLSNADLSAVYLIFADLIFADLRGAELFSADLRNAELRNAELFSAELFSADLRNADLRNANLSYANLRSADLRSADLRSADLSDALLLATDLRGAKNLLPDQLIGENQPYLCNVALPSTIAGLDPNRDCDAMPQVLVGRYGIPPEAAQRWVDEARQEQWK